MEEIRTWNRQDQKRNATQHIIVKALIKHRKESIMKTGHDKKHRSHLKTETDISLLITGNLSTLLSWIKSWPGQNIKRETIRINWNSTPSGLNRY